MAIYAQLRTRFEFRDGTYRPLAPNELPAALISDRIRLSFDYKYKSSLIVKISPQTLGIWGQANMVQGIENGGNKIAIFEAWSKLRISDFVNVKIGRQVISLDDERFFGETDWLQGGRVHDAVSLNFNKNNFEIKSFFAYNQNYKTLYGNNYSNVSGNSYNTTDAFPYKWMQTVWGLLPIGKKSKITLLATNLGFQQSTISARDTVVYYNQTFGINFYYNCQKISAMLIGYFQCGQNSFGVTTQAYLASASISYKINDAFFIGMGSDLVSGNNVGSSQNINTAFNPYFHTGHKFYGNMDYYYVGNSHKNAGISDSYFKITCKNKGNSSINLALHQFVTPNNIKDISKVYDSNLGQEADLYALYKLNKFATFEVGYSFYLTTPTVNFLKNIPNGKYFQQWVWTSVNITPQLFKSKF